MFEPAVYAQLRTAAHAAAEARIAAGLATPAQLCDAARVVQQAQDLLDGVAADLAARIEQTLAHHEEGAPTVAAWMARELRVPTAQARTRVAAGRTLRRLPETAEALGSGDIRLDHVHAFTSGLKKLGDQTLADAMGVLPPVAKESDPHELRQAIDHLHQVICPEDLDEAWARGMDRQDVTLARCGDGYHLTGFLDQLTGATLHTFPNAASTGDGPDDDRTPAERRVDAAFASSTMPPNTVDPATGSDHRYTYSPNWTHCSAGTAPRQPT